MTPTKPAGHEDVPEDALQHFIDYAAAVGPNGDPGVNTGRLASMSAELLSFRRAKAPAQATELAPDVKGLVERLRAEADMYGYGQDQPTGLLREAANVLSRIAARPHRPRPKAAEGSRPEQVTFPDEGREGRRGGDAE